MTSTVQTTHGGGTPVLPRAALVAVGVSVVLSLVSLAVVHHPLTRDGGALRSYLDVLRGANLPTWWSTILLTGGALAHTVTGLAARVARVPGGAAWFAGAALLALLSLTVHTGLHHRLDGLGRQLFGETAWTTDWLPLATIAGVGVGAAFALVASWLTGRARGLVLVGSVVLLTGALGGDYVAVHHAAELGENLGAALLLAAALGALDVTREGPVLRVRYRTRRPPTRPQPQAEALPVRETVT